MGDALAIYPKICRKNITTIMNATSAKPETAYAMILMTATLMDLSPWDDSVAEMVLADCKRYKTCGSK